MSLDPHYSLISFVCFYESFCSFLLSRARRKQQQQQQEAKLWEEELKYQVLSATVFTQTSGFHETTIIAHHLLGMTHFFVPK